MSDTMTQEEAINMSNEQAAQILIPMRNMMCDQHGCPISDAVFALDKAIEALSADMPQEWIPCRRDVADEEWEKRWLEPLENLPRIEVSEEDELKFYYVDSIDAYWIGRRLDNFYYAEWINRLGFVWTRSRYLPWGEHVVDEQTLWKEYTYPSEPREIPFTEWIVGFMKKHSVIPKEREGEWVESPYEDADGMPAYRCSECGCLCGGGLNYCFMCGAKMRGNNVETD